MKKLLIFLLAVVFLVAAGTAVASPGNQYGKAKTPPFPQPAEKDLQKVVFIRYAPGKEPRFICGDDVCEKGENWKKCPSDCEKPGNGEEEPTPTPEESACYGFLSGAKPRWNWVEDYYSSDHSLATASAKAVSTWEGATRDIFGEGFFGYSPWGDYDLINSVSYGNYGDPNALAVTAIWFRGKNIYEYDIMMDIDYFPNKGYDLDTVVLHEFGHGAGLDDLYDEVCINEVMYGYLGEGETKDTLGPGDTIGIQTLYGL